MKRGLLVALLIAVAAFTAVVPASAQWQSITTDNITSTTSTGTIKVGPSANPTTFNTDGTVDFSIGKADGYVFVPALTACRSDGTAYTVTRVAAGDWAFRRTLNIHEVQNWVCSLNSVLQRVGGTRGIKITSIAIHQQIVTAALGFATWGRLGTKAYANNTANDVGPDRATAPTLPTATQTNPYLTTVTVTTPLYLPANTNQELNFEFAVEGSTSSGSGVHTLYGFGANYTRLD